MILGVLFGAEAVALLDGDTTWRISSEITEGRKRPSMALHHMITAQDIAR